MLVSRAQNDRVYIFCAAVDECARLSVHTLEEWLRGEALWPLVRQRVGSVAHYDVSAPVFVHLRSDVLSRV